MIDIHVQGSSWAEVSQELRQLVYKDAQSDYEELEALRRERVKAAGRYEGLEDYLAEVRADLEGKLNAKDDEVAGLATVIDEMEALIHEKNTRIAELEKQLADAEAANPTPAGATTADTETTAPDTGSAPVKPEEEQTGIPEVTEAPVKEYTKPDVRAVLMKCRAKNIPISDVLAPYGGSLGAVKEEDYAAVVAAAEKALEGK